MNSKLIVSDLKKQSDRLTSLLNGSGITSDSFIASVTVAFSKNKGLLNCSQESLMGCVFAAAELGLVPTDQKGEAYIIPYGKNATFQLGYQGLITLMYRSGVTTVRSNVIYENDKYEYEDGLELKLSHSPALKNRGKPIATYAIAIINGEKIIKFMSQEDIGRIKKLSKGAGSGRSPWDSQNDPQNWMWQKTVLKQLAKVLPKSEKLSKAIYVDNVCERGGTVEISEDKKETKIKEAKWSEIKTEYNLDRLKKDYGVIRKEISNGVTAEDILDRMRKLYNVKDDVIEKLSEVTPDSIDKILI